MRETKLYLIATAISILFITSAAFGQKVSVFIDSDASPSTAVFDIVIVVDDPQDVVRSILISRPGSNPIEWETINTSTSKSKQAKLKVLDGKPTKYQLIALGADGSVRAVKDVTVAGGTSESNAKNANAATPGNGQGNDKIELIKPKPEVERLYDLAIKPHFDLNLLPKAKYYRVENNRSNEPFEVSINIDKDDSKKVQNPQYVEVELYKGNNEITVSVLDSDKKAIADYNNKITIACDDPCESFGRSVNTRAIIGLEQVGASSAVGRTNPFLDFFINVPLGDNHSPKETPPRVSIWSDFRLSSTASQRFANLSNITTNILRPGATADVNEVVQSFRVNAGMAVRIIPEKSLFTSFLPGRSSVSVIFGAGVTSPLSSGKGSVTEIFKIPKENGEIIPEFRELFPQVSNDKDNIGFVTPERDRFLRRWFVGGRLLTRFSRNDSRQLDISPATLDVTFGQDEAITRKLSGFVLSFEGFTPFPIKRFDYLYLYAGISTRLTRKVNTNVPSFFLEPADIGDLDDPLKTVLISTDENRLTISNRDKYFFGIGVDLIRLFRREDQPR